MVIHTCMATSLRETGIAHGLGKYPLFSIRSRHLKKLKVTVGLMLILVDQSCVNGNQESVGKFSWSHLCC